MTLAGDAGSGRTKEHHAKVSVPETVRGLQPRSASEHLLALVEYEGRRLGFLGEVGRSRNGNRETTRQ